MSKQKVRVSAESGSRFFYTTMKIKKKVYIELTEDEYRKALDNLDLIACQADSVQKLVQGTIKEDCEDEAAMRLDCIIATANALFKKLNSKDGKLTLL